MNTTEDQKLTTADFVAAAERPAPPAQRQQREDRDTRTEPDGGPMRTQDEPGDRAAAGGEPLMRQQDEPLAPLFLPQLAHDFRAQWDEVQIGFVDDPTRAVRRADELVAQVMKNLAQTFAEERASVESRMDQADTEHLRVALRRYRSFFQRLLSL